MDEPKLRFDEDEIRESLKTRLEPSLIETIIFTLKVEKCAAWVKQSMERIEALKKEGDEIVAKEAHGKIPHFTLQMLVARETHEENVARLEKMMKQRPDTN